LPVIVGTKHFLPLRYDLIEKDAHLDDFASRLLRGGRGRRMQRKVFWSAMFQGLGRPALKPFIAPAAAPDCKY